MFGLQARPGNADDGAYTLTAISMTSGATLLENCLSRCEWLSYR
jgi:hypothetical protein